MTLDIWKILIIILVLFTGLNAIKVYHADYEYQISNLEERIGAVEGQVYDVLRGKIH